MMPSQILDCKQPGSSSWMHVCDMRSNVKYRRRHLRFLPLSLLSLTVPCGTSSCNYFLVQASPTCAWSSRVCQQITQAEVNAGVVSNTATAKATAAIGDSPTNSSTFDKTLGQDLSIEISEILVAASKKYLD